MAVGAEARPDELITHGKPGSRQAKPGLTPVAGRRVEHLRSLTPQYVAPGFSFPILHQWFSPVCMISVRGTRCDDTGSRSTTAVRLQFSASEVAGSPFKPEAVRLARHVVDRCMRCFDSQRSHLESHLINPQTLSRAARRKGREHFSSCTRTNLNPSKVGEYGAYRPTLRSPLPSPARLTAIISGVQLLNRPSQDAFESTRLEVSLVVTR